MVGSAGDPQLVTHFRSSAKPIQALPARAGRPDLDDAEIAIACASHLARPEQLDAVRSLLAKAPASEDDLECGPEPTRLEHNCSGKHAGLLALCRAREWPIEGYRLPSIRASRRSATRSRSAAEVDPGSMPTAADGCGILDLRAPLERMAHAFSRLDQLEGARGSSARCAHIPISFAAAGGDTVLMRTQPGWVAKEALRGCSAPSPPTASASRSRSRTAAAGDTACGGQVPRSLGVDAGELGQVRVENSRAEVVGELRALRERSIVMSIVDESSENCCECRDRTLCEIAKSD